MKWLNNPVIHALSAIVVGVAFYAIYDRAKSAADEVGELTAALDGATILAELKSYGSDDPNRTLHCAASVWVQQLVGLAEVHLDLIDVLERITAQEVARRVAVEARLAELEAKGGGPSIKAR